MSAQDECPACAADLRGAPIPPAHIEAGHYPPGETHYSRLIGVQAHGYDGVLYWACPDCGHRWHRWPEGHYLYAKAIPFVEGWGAPVS